MVEKNVIIAIDASDIVIAAEDEVALWYCLYRAGFHKAVHRPIEESQESSFQML
jgi:hypothetical protein